MPSWWWFALVRRVSQRPSQRLFPRPLMRRRALFMLCAVALVGVLPARAAAVRTYWNFAWDPHPMAAEIGYFTLVICVGLRCEVHRLDGGTRTDARNIFVDPTVVGDGTAVVRACTPAGKCSGDSNTVVLDRTAPQPPTAVEYGFNQR